jgi:hypothetical protein
MWRTQQDEWDKIPVLRFSDGALDTFRNWRADLEKRLRSGELSPALEGHLSKYRKLVPGLALINHLATGSGPVSETAVLQACSFAVYLESHARRIYGASNLSERSAAKAILARIRKEHLKGPFSLRDIQRHDWSGLTVHEHIQSGLDLLVELDHLAIQPSPVNPGKGRPSTVYLINPRTVR